MKRIVVVGTQWGDEGKGKITDFLAQKADVVTRYQGGNNAGHTVVIDHKKYALHLLPSGILNADKVNILANGMVINIEALIAELKNLNHTDYQLFISDRAHVTFPFHITLDKHEEFLKTEKIGTTNKGIGPTYKDKASRIGIRVATLVSNEFESELRKLIDEKNIDFKNYGLPLIDFDSVYKTYQAYANIIKPLVKDTSLLLNDYIGSGKNILFEGAQGTLLCLDHGTYPFVTSSSPTAASVPLNTGVAPWLIDGAIGVTKAYSTRVGAGVMPTEISGDIAQSIRIKGNEFGTTTGRPRRIGWLDCVVLNYTNRVSGLSYLAITLLDVLSGLDTIKICTSYTLDGKEIFTIPAHIKDYEKCVANYIELPGWHEDITGVKSFDALPVNAQNYLNKITELTKIPLAIFSVGPRRDQTIEVSSIFED
ncbi:adenylosuccinate synthase [Acholeplasma granularum]|uniref:adenylosuccinate synthase n=1 Tax=Acholeplasma granularum TaxID=264635 RepID=UPI00046FB15B|nr:adenylosuccinate synthase [Acholeplasma granularum]